MTNDEALGMLDDIDKPGEVTLTDWEVNFIDSLMKQVEAGRRLTEKQTDMLAKIHAERVK